MTLCALQRLLIGGWLLVLMSNSYAFSWQLLWATPDQQAAALMQQADFAGAKALFNHKAWRAAAAFRAKDYQQAARDFEALHSETGYYNQGNALAHLQQYEQAIKAYDLALAINPNNQDARYNRELVSSLLKQQQENKQQNNSSTSDNKSQQESKQDNASGKEQQQSSNSPAKQDKAKANEQADKPSSDEKQTANSSDSQQQQKQVDRASQDKADEKNTSPPKSMTAEEAAKAKEQQQANEQWLRLIPDDPGGLLREKFLRDYIRRQRGWYQ